MTYRIECSLDGQLTVILKINFQEYFHKILSLCQVLHDG